MSFHDDGDMIPDKLDFCSELPLIVRDCITSSSCSSKNVYKKTDSSYWECPMALSVFIPTLTKIGHSVYLLTDVSKQMMGRPERHSHRSSTAGETLASQLDGCKHWHRSSTAGETLASQLEGRRDTGIAARHEFLRSRLFKVTPISGQAAARNVLTRFVFYSASNK
jgi:hypothetical protein